MMTFQPFGKKIEFYLRLVIEHGTKNKKEDFHQVSMVETAKLFDNEAVNLKPFMNKKVIHMLPIYDKRMQHFKLSVANYDKKEFFFFDSLLNDQHHSKAKEIMEKWMSKTGNKTLGWKATSPAAGRLQTDSINCGVFCIIFAERFIEHYDKNEESKYSEKFFIAIERKRVEQNILKWADDLQTICVKCLQPCDVSCVSTCIMCKRPLHGSCKSKSVGTVESVDSNKVICSDFIVNRKGKNRKGNQDDSPIK